MTLERTLHLPPAMGFLSSYDGDAPFVYFGSTSSFVKADYKGLLRGILVDVQAGGGAGGGAGTSAAGQVSGGTGGGSGGWAYGWIPVDALAASETVTVGAGGTGVSGAAGNSGSNSSFGTHLTAVGGPGGTFLATGSAVATLLAPDRAVAGSATGGGTPIWVASGNGAAHADRTIGGSFMSVSPGAPSRWAGGGTVGMEANGGAGLYGSGGGGARQANAAGSARTGGAGGDGFVLVWLLY